VKVYLELEALKSTPGQLVAFRKRKEKRTDRFGGEADRFSVVSTAQSGSTGRAAAIVVGTGRLAYERTKRSAVDTYTRVESTATCGTTKKGVGVGTRGEWVPDLEKPARRKA